MSQPYPFPKVQAHQRLKLYLQASDDSPNCLALHICDSQLPPYRSIQPHDSTITCVTAWSNVVFCTMTSSGGIVRQIQNTGVQRYEESSFYCHFCPWLFCGDCNPIKQRELLQMNDIMDSLYTVEITSLFSYILATHNQWFIVDYIFEPDRVLKPCLFCVSTFVSRQIILFHTSI